MHNPVITAWIQEQPVDLQPIFLQLRQIIFEEIPHVKEYMAYQLPFYGCYGRLCYFNHRKGIAELGLCQGAFLSNDQNLLMGEGKEVRHVCMKSLADMNPIVIRSILQEAILLNQWKRRTNKK